MAKKVIVLLAEGFEEVEAVTHIDYLRRAGLELVTAAVGTSRTVQGSHGIKIEADTLLDGLEKEKQTAAFWDAALIPGGMPGASNLASSVETSALLREMAAAGKIVAAICASPAVVLAPLGLLKNKNYTCYPGMEAEVDPAFGTKWSEEKVVVDGNIITSRGAGTAAAFAMALIGALQSPEEAEKIARKVLL